MRRPIRTAAFHLVIFLAACALIVSRRPDSLFQARFLAEDGHVWFADAYNLGWIHTLFRSQDGYYQTLPRLAAALSLLVPFRFAPLAMNLCALAVQATPVSLLLSQRCSRWGSWGLRAAMALVYLGLPNSREMSVTITEAQWYLALIACILLLSFLPRGRLGKVFDAAVFVLCGLTGPFCVLLLPIAAWALWIAGETRRWLPIGVFTVSAAVQASALLITDHAGRTRIAPLGASWPMFVRILSGHVYLGALLGQNFYGLVGRQDLLELVVIAGTALVVVVAVWSETEIRLFLLFVALTFFAGLRSPTTGPPNGLSAWIMLAKTPGIRYWFLPDLAFLWALLVCVSGISIRGLSGLSAQVVLLAKFACALLLAVACFGVWHDWRIAPFPDLNFAGYAQRLEQAPQGEMLVIPENPPGWKIVLTKR